MKHIAFLLLALFLWPALCSALASAGETEIRTMVETLNKRLERKTPEDGFFIVIQEKDNSKINSFRISYFIYKKEKKLTYELNETNESGHFFASVGENGKVLKVVCRAAGDSSVYFVKMVNDLLSVFDDKGTLLFPQTPGAEATDQQVLTTADQMPKPAFDLGAYLGDNLHYPETARLHNKEGKALVRFVVNEDGAISTVELLKGFDDDCDAEALRVVKNMPKWIPAKKDGKNVKVYFTLPLRFKLTD